jgi:SAM-dependent methyltransferase
MPSTDPREHWERIYATKADEQLSWFEPLPEISVRLLAAAGMTSDSCVLDVGGGESRLVDYLLARGLECVAVLDVSSAALDRARTRLGAAAAVPTWIASDVTSPWALKPMDIWHDRAVFHFLTGEDARTKSREHLRDVLKPGGAAIIATFALDGPEKCSGLPIARYSAGTLAGEFAGVLDLVESVHHTHTTPWGATQSFQYSRFVKR